MWTQHPNFSSRQHCLTCLHCLLYSTQLTTTQFPLIVTPLGIYIILGPHNIGQQRPQQTAPRHPWPCYYSGCWGGRGAGGTLVRKLNQWRRRLCSVTRREVTSVADYFHPRYPPPGQGGGCSVVLWAYFSSNLSHIDNQRCLEEK